MYIYNSLGIYIYIHTWYIHENHWESTFMSIMMTHQSPFRYHLPFFFVSLPPPPTPQGDQTRRPCGWCLGSAEGRLHHLPDDGRTHWIDWIHSGCAGCCATATAAVGGCFCCCFFTAKHGKWRWWQWEFGQTWWCILRYEHWASWGVSTYVLILLCN